jgi:hypothetical protein
MSDEGFLSRWSRRKVEAKQEVAAPAEASPTVPPGETEALTLQPLGEGRSGGPPDSPAPLPEEPPPPTMDDVAALPTGADIRQFMAPKVDAGVKRAALKKLFADPRFNVMDGLDTYIDDYGKPDPIPMSMLRQMAQAQLLGLFDHEETAKASPDGATPPAVPQSSTDPLAVPPDEDPDLRLQQDDAAGPGGTGEGPAA